MPLTHRCAMWGENGHDVRSCPLPAVKKFVAALHAAAKSRQSGRKPLEGKTDAPTRLEVQPTAASVPGGNRKSPGGAAEES